MLTCPQCQLTNPLDHKFCQRCGEPLPSGPAPTSPSVEASETKASESKVSETPEQATEQTLQARLMPPEKLELHPATFLDADQRYQVLTVLSRGSALIEDTTPEVRSPLQEKLSELALVPASTLQAQPNLPAAAYPYLLLSEAAPPLYDAWQQDDTTVLIAATEPPTLSTLVGAFSTAVAPLQYVYWMYTLTDLWASLAPVPEWRSSLLLANNLGIDAEQAVRIRQFIPPATAPTDQPPSLSDLKAFLQSLLAQPHRGSIAPLRQIRQIILTVTSAQTLEQLRSELAAIGESLLATPEAITPAVNASANVPLEENAFTSADFTSAEFASPPASAPIINPPKTASPLDPAPISSLYPVATRSDMDPNTASTPSPDGLPNGSASAHPPDDIGLDDIDIPEPAESDESTMVLPMKLTALEDAGRTNVGRQRDHNEDCFFINNSTQKRSDNDSERTQAHCLYVLCDGMGGHDGGEVASKLAAQTLTTYFDEHWPHPQPGQPPSPLPTQETLVEAVKLANQAIFEVNEKEGRAGHERMGTTLVVVLLQGTEAVVAHVGDSRLYQHARRGGLRQVTTDHEVGQREIKRGVPHDIAYARPDAYQLTQALGPRDSEDLHPSVSYLNFSEDTLLLLCSDGLCDNNLVEDHLKSHIDPLLRGQKPLEMGMDELIDLANEVNGHDNISAITVHLTISPDMQTLQRNNAANAGQTILQ